MLSKRSFHSSTIFLKINVTQGILWQCVPSVSFGITEMNCCNTVLVSWRLNREAENYHQAKSFMWCHFTFLIFHWLTFNTDGKMASSTCVNRGWCWNLWRRKFIELIDTYNFLLRDCKYDCWITKNSRKVPYLYFIVRKIIRHIFMCACHVSSIFTVLVTDLSSVN